MSHVLKKTEMRLFKPEKCWPWQIKLINKCDINFLPIHLFENDIITIILKQNIHLIPPD